MPYATINPFTDELVKEYPQHGSDQVEHALATADAVFHSDWSCGPIERRLTVLTKLADLLTERTEVFATAISTEKRRRLTKADLFHRGTPRGAPRPLYLQIESHLHALYGRN